MKLLIDTHVFIWWDNAAMEELEALQIMRQFPNRIRCATLAWHTPEDALSAIES